MMHQDWTGWTGTSPDLVFASMDLWFLPGGARALHHDRAVYVLRTINARAELICN